jgi:polyphosphate kinase
VKKAAREFESILVSQYNMTDIFEQEINAQIKRKKKNLSACIRIKLNNLEDTGMIDLLYKAAKAGVQIKLIVRSICALNTQEKGLKGNIEVKRIVDRFLEHSRIFIFGEEGKTKIYMGSSDWMTRNLHHRIEVCVPIKQQSLARELEDYFTIQWNDHVKASSVEMENSSYMQDNGGINGEEKRCSQQEIYNYLKARQ